MKDTYKKEGNTELKSYVGYLGEGNSQEIIEENHVNESNVVLKGIKEEELDGIE